MMKENSKLMNGKANQPSIKRNYIYNTLYQVLILIIPLITAPYIGRVLGADKIGIQSYTNSIVTYFTLVAALGTVSYGQREIAMHRDDKYESSKLFWEIEIVSLFTTVMVTIAWVIWIFITPKYSIYYTILTMTLVAVAFDISWYFAGFELFQYIVIRNFIVKIVGTILLFICIHKPSDLLLYVTILAASGLLGNISMWTYLPGRLTKVSIRELHPFRHFKQTLVYFVPTIAISVYTVLDKTMIGAITGSEVQNGYYEQATKIVRMTLTLVYSLNTVMTSRMSYLFSEKRIEEIKVKLLQSFDFLLAIAIPMMFGLIGIARNFVPWFYGTGYDPVIELIILMSPLPVVVCISNILGHQYLTPSGLRVRSSKAIIIGAVINLCLNSILIKLYGANGATVASIIAEAVISVIYVWMSKGYISWKQICEKSWKRIVAGAVMLVLVIIIGNDHMGSISITILQIAVGIFSYVLILSIMKDTFLMNMLKKIRNKFRG